MATDCAELSPKAQAIFAKLEPFFPPDLWKRSRWKKEGIIENNGEYDLRKHSDRKKLTDERKSLIGYLVEIAASMYCKEKGSLVGFTKEHYTELMQNTAELLLILNDLDFQIETLDFIPD